MKSEPTDSPASLLWRLRVLNLRAQSLERLLRDELDALTRYNQQHEQEKNKC